MCLGAHMLRARSLATVFSLARVKHPAERLLIHRTQFPMDQNNKLRAALNLISVLCCSLFLSFIYGNISSQYPSGSSMK